MQLASTSTVTKMTKPGVLSATLPVMPATELSRRVMKLRRVSHAEARIAKISSPTEAYSSGSIASTSCR